MKYQTGDLVRIISADANGENLHRVGHTAVVLNEVASGENLDVCDIDYPYTLLMAKDGVELLARAGYDAESTRSLNRYILEFHRIEDNSLGGVHLVESPNSQEQFETDYETAIEEARRQNPDEWDLDMVIDLLKIKGYLFPDDCEHIEVTY